MYCSPSLERLTKNRSYKRGGLIIKASLYRKYNILHETCGLSREVVFQWRGLSQEGGNCNCFRNHGDNSKCYEQHMLTDAIVYVR